jgi:hypothetical protein
MRWGNETNSRHLTTHDFSNERWIEADESVATHSPTQGYRATLCVEKSNNASVVLTAFEIILTPTARSNSRGYPRTCNWRSPAKSPSRAPSPSRRPDPCPRLKRGLHPGLRSHFVCPPKGGSLGGTAEPQACQQFRPRQVPAARWHASGDRTRTTRRAQCGLCPPLSGGVQGWPTLDMLTPLVEADSLQISDDGLECVKNGKLGHTVSTGLRGRMNDDFPLWMCATHLMKNPV